MCSLQVYVVKPVGECGEMRETPTEYFGSLGAFIYKLSELLFLSTLFRICLIPSYFHTVSPFFVIPDSLRTSAYFTGFFGPVFSLLSKNNSQVRRLWTPACFPIDEGERNLRLKKRVQKWGTLKTAESQVLKSSSSAVVSKVSGRG
jgi:hypothetical protein